MDFSEENWHLRYLSIAREVASWSKDPSTKVGAVAVGSQGQILSTGYNGFPRGIKDTPERLNDRETKYNFTIHAEMNVIFNAALSNVSLKGSTLYARELPICHECAKGIIQAGISRVVFDLPNGRLESVAKKWSDSWKLTLEMFNEAGVEVVNLDNE